MESQKTKEIVEAHWDDWFVKGLSDFVRIPNLSPMYDDDYLTNGLLERAIEHVHDCISKLDIVGISRQIFRTESGMPLVCYVVEPSSPEIKTNVLLYGHLDKQPHLEGWGEGLGPTNPVIRGELLYGRGSSDDGYAPFACMLAIKAAQVQGAPMPRICLVLELEEESGSVNLLPLLTLAKEATGTPDFLFCMDSGCMDYDQMWMTSSLRGHVRIDVEVQVGLLGYHSGETGGIVPETFRVLRMLLDRLDDKETGQVSQEFQAEIPEWKLREAEKISELKGMSLCTKFPLVDGCHYQIPQGGIKELYLNNVWRPQMAITGMSEMPQIATAGNVLRPKTAVRISMRIPPVLDPKQVRDIIVQKLTTDVPYNAKVTILKSTTGRGWCMREPQPWLSDAIKQAA